MTELNKAIKFLVWLGKFAAEFMQKVLTSKSCIDSLYELFVTALSYRLKKVIRSVLRGVQDINKAASEGAKEGRKLLAVIVHGKKIEKKIPKAYNRTDSKG